LDPAEVHRANFDQHVIGFVGETPTSTVPINLQGNRRVADLSLNTESAM
jgi:hypothetical protein